MKDQTYLIIVIIILLVFVLLNSIITPKETFEVRQGKIERPFVNVYDQNGRTLNVALLSRPFYLDKHYEDYKKIKTDFLILGISSYQEFPNQPRNPKDNYNQKNIYDAVKWTNMCEGWLHCFKNKDDYIPKTMDSILLSESDFIDCQVHKPNTTVTKKYDFIYICHRDDEQDCSTDEWVAYNKNLKLANQCFKIMCNKFKLKGLLIGRVGCSLPSGCEKYLDATPKLDYTELMKKYDEVKFIFIPNIHDASPRVLTEALCHNIPCFINQNIVGGWKYVTPETGHLFNSLDDFEPNLQQFLDNMNTYSPRSHFIQNYGIIHSGKKLRDFCVKVFGNRLNVDINTIDYLTLEVEKKNYKHCLT